MGCAVVRMTKALPSRLRGLTSAAGYITIERLLFPVLSTPVSNT
jgi:hypothetical protein